MNVLTVPKKAAVLEYSLLRLPATVLQKQVVVRFLQDDSALRLGFERALGSLDEKAGRLLDDQALITRGSALRRRSEVLADAARLEESAAQRTADADADLQQEQARVAAKRTQAEKTRRDGVKKAAAAKAVANKRVVAAAAAREKAETARVQAEAKAKVVAAKAKADAAAARIDAEEKAVTAAPKAQLAAATQEKAAADEQRAKADTLSTLAGAEKASRDEA